MSYMKENEVLNKFGSPLFVLDKKMLLSRFNDIKSAFNKYYPTTIAYSYKTNYLPYICNLLKNEGAFAEIIPGFEFELAKRLGIKGENIIVNGPYKPIDELEKILKYGCKINADNLYEIKAISDIAKRLNKKVKIGIRINAKIGDLPWNKFGFNIENGETQEILGLLQRLDTIEIVGLHMHIGTNISKPELYSSAINKLLDFYKENKARINLEYIDLGGGFASSGTTPINTKDDEWNVPHIGMYAKYICKPLNTYFKNQKPQLILEPGRFLVDESMYLLTKITSIKEIFGVRSLFIDAGVNILPSSYYRAHQIEPLNKKGLDKIITDVYGPLCMQVDLLESSICLPRLTVGDVLKVKNCGAYELSQSMQFIRARPAVVCIDKNDYFMIRRKEQFKDITTLDNWKMIK